VQVRDDHVFYLFRLDAEEREAALGRWIILRPRRAPTRASKPVSMTKARAFERASQTK